MLAVVVSLNVSILRNSGGAKDEFAMAVARAYPTVDEHALIIPAAVKGYIHDTFERSFCHQLVESEHKVFASVNNCHFLFVYNPVKEALAVVPQTN